jgi:Family of unknown function (DUF6114)
MMEMTAQEAPLVGRRQKQYRRFGLHNVRLNFRRWRRSRPFWGGFFSILGGAIIGYLPTMAIKLIIASGTTVIVAIAVGLLIVVFGLFLWFAPYLRQITGVLIVLLAVVSLITSNFGGFFIGMIFAIVGGSLGFSWVPTEPRIKKWRIRRLLHLPVPAVQPELELRGITTLASAELVGVPQKTEAAAPAVAVPDENASASDPT